MNRIQSIIVSATAVVWLLTIALTAAITHHLEMRPPTPEWKTPVEIPPEQQWHAKTLPETTPTTPPIHVEMDKVGGLGMKIINTGTSPLCIAAVRVNATILPVFWMNDTETGRYSPTHPLQPNEYLAIGPGCYQITSLEVTTNKGTYNIPVLHQVQLPR